MSFWRALKGYRRFRQLSPEQRRLVFYSEGRGDWPHLEPLIRELTTSSTPITYLTSSADDPGHASSLVIPLYVGTGVVRTILFRTINVNALVMTMPDLNSFHLRKSVHPVRYVYVFHAINSVQMIYLKHAFDAYDAILCCGPHHVSELREIERLNGLPKRMLIEHGYGRLDTLLATGFIPAARRQPSEKIRVLLAPTWGKSSIVELVAHELIEKLLKAGFDVTFRPHPMSYRQSKRKLDDIVSAFSDHPYFAFDNNVASYASMVTSDIMITDWSGIAFEYAFALLKPILFIDVPPKVRNPDYREISSPPLEVTLRSELGEVLPVADIADAPARIEALVELGPVYRQKLEALRGRWIFNVGTSAQAGAAAIRNILSPKIQSPL